MKRYVGKKASIATGVVTAFLAAAPGSPQASPSAAPDASATSGGEIASPAALDAIKSKAERIKVTEDKPKPPVVIKPGFRKAFAKENGPSFVQSR